jgi:hypothetical protein
MLPPSSGRSTSETSVNFYQTTRRNNQKTAIFVLAAVRTWNITEFNMLKRTRASWMRNVTCEASYNMHFRLMHAVLITSLAGDILRPDSEIGCLNTLKEPWRHTLVVSLQNPRLAVDSSNTGISMFHHSYLCGLFLPFRHNFSDEISRALWACFIFRKFSPI